MMGVCIQVDKELTPLNGHVHIKVWEKQADGTEKIVKDDVEALLRRLETNRKNVRLFPRNLKKCSIKKKEFFRE